MIFKSIKLTNFLSNKKEGITVALIENNHPGLKQLYYHNPLDKSETLPLTKTDKLYDLIINFFNSF